MKNLILAGVAGILTAGGLLSACTEGFSGCLETRTCPRQNDGGTGDPSAAGGGMVQAAGGAQEPEGGRATGSGGDQGGGTLGVGGSEPSSAGAPVAVGGSENGEGGAGGTPTELGGTGGSSGGSSPVDTTPPTVVSITPSNGATGIESNAVITVTFSEAMNKAVTQQAFQSANLDVTFKWTSSAVLVATPKVPLAYAQGTHSQAGTLAALSYSATIIDSAEDLAGNPLASDATSTFKTLRQLSVKEPLSDAYAVWTTGAVYNEFHESDCDLNPGDSSTKHSARDLLEFSISNLPSGAQIAAATLYIYQWSVKGAPYATLGTLTATHTNELPVAAGSFSSAGLRALGTLSSTATLEWKSVDATAAVADDYANRVARQQRSQYRVGFGTITDNDAVDDYVGIICDSGDNPYLAVSYLIP